MRQGVTDECMAKSKQVLIMEPSARRIERGRRRMIKLSGWNWMDTQMAWWLPNEPCLYLSRHIEQPRKDAALLSAVKCKYAQVVVHKEIHSRTCCLLLSAQLGRNKQRLRIRNATSQEMMMDVHVVLDVWLHSTTDGWWVVNGDRMIILGEETSRRMAHWVNRKLIMFFNRKLRTADEQLQRSKWSWTELRINLMM